jgi:hypothetical protein
MFDPPPPFTSRGCKATWLETAIAYGSRYAPQAIADGNVTAAGRYASYAVTYVRWHRNRRHCWILTDTGDHECSLCSSWTSGLTSRKDLPLYGCTQRENPNA